MAGACHAYRVVALASSVSRTFIACTIFSCIISHVTKKKKICWKLLATKGYMFQCCIRIESYSRNIVFLNNEHLPLITCPVPTPCLQCTEGEHISSLQTKLG